MRRQTEKKNNGIARLNRRLVERYSPARLLGLLFATGVVSGILLKKLADLSEFFKQGLVVALLLAVGLPVLAVGLVEVLRICKLDGWLMRREKKDKR